MNRRFLARKEELRHARAVQTRARTRAPGSSADAINASSPRALSHRMSLISDALKKAELQRSNPELKDVSGWGRRSGVPTAEPQQTSSTKSSRALVFSNVAALALLCMVAIYFFRDQPMGAATEPLSAANEAQDDFESTTSRASATVEPESSLEGAEERAAETSASPFLPPSESTADRPPPTEEYSLVGTSSLGSNTLVSIVRLSDRRSSWIPLGKTVGEVTAVSYNPDTDQAVIRVRGNLLTITMDVVPPAASEPEAEAAAPP